ncbi:MAG: LysM peptidoglycan-binding domain-containing protein [Anaerolineales bacterium]|nr:LysM peptidoglycan-binding domain-containing protein [Anaerolineales bacterium]
MKALRQMGSGFIIGVISLLLVIGGISLSLAETTAPSPPSTPSPLPTTFAVEFASPLLSPTLFPTLPPEISTDTLTPIPTATLAQTQPCSIPAGWTPIVVGVNDTLYSIAERYKTTADNLNTSNCLNDVVPPAGSVIYVPPVPTVTVIPCGPPSTWRKTHIVKPGENLYRISLLYRTTVAQLQSANCMGSSTIIHVGQALYVPNVPTSTPAATSTAARTSTSTMDFSTPTPTPSNTPDFSTPTNTATKTPDFSTPTQTSTPPSPSP